jgi:hypothetical protein
MIVLACASHVLIDLPLFGGPVLALAGGVLWTVRNERRRARQVDTEEPAPVHSDRPPLMPVS